MLRGCLEEAKGDGPDRLPGLSQLSPERMILIKYKDGDMSVRRAVLASLFLAVPELGQQDCHALDEWRLTESAQARDGTLTGVER